MSGCSSSWRGRFGAPPPGLRQPVQSLGAAGARETARVRDSARRRRQPRGSGTPAARRGRSIDGGRGRGRRRDCIGSSARAGGVSHSLRRAAACGTRAGCPSHRLLVRTVRGCGGGHCLGAGRLRRPSTGGHAPIRARRLGKPGRRPGQEAPGRGAGRPLGGRSRGRRVPGAQPLPPVAGRSRIRGRPRVRRADRRPRPGGGPAAKRLALRRSAPSPGTDSGRGVGEPE